MEKFEFIRPETPKKQIEFCLESFDKKEAVKRICQWIDDTLDNVDVQITNYENMHHVSIIDPMEGFVEIARGRHYKSADGQIKRGVMKIINGVQKWLIPREDLS